jgi:hypothetical protein
MVRLKQQPETDVWVAIHKKAVSFNSLNAIYDEFYYKNEIIVNSCTGGNQLRLQLRGKHVILKFGSPEAMEAFYRIVK